MKKIFSGFIMIFPYLFVLLSYIIIKGERGIHIEEKDFITLTIMTIIMLIILFIVYIPTLICMICKWKSKTVMLINLLIKIIYIPVHFVLFLLIGAFGNPFLLILMPIPFIISIMFMGMTGTLSVAANINAYKSGNYKLSNAIIYSLLSYCYIVDIVVAIITFVKVNKKEKNMC